MGSITTGVGLISGINTAQLIDSLIALESRPKITLQQRVAVLQSQQTALMDINARLLNLKSASRAFRIDKIFQSALATSSNEETLTATAAKGAQPGTYSFLVKQLVSTSQQLSKGFADKTTTPLGLTSLSFEFGHGNLQVDRDLANLNGGAGIDRGRIVITDRSGAQATIDLTDVTTLDEVLDRINDSTGVSVTASVSGDHLVITDTSGGAGTLTIANAAGDTTATDLGIAGNGTGNTLTGIDINTISGNTSLRSLNDGAGALVSSGSTDLRITARDGTIIDVDLGRINAPITNSTLLSDLNNGQGVTISDDEENPDIKFIARDGTEFEVSLEGVTTVGGLISRINTQTSGRIALSVTDGETFTVTDTAPGGATGNLRILGAGDNGADTAEDLGILNVAGVAADSYSGTVITNVATAAPVSTIEEVLDRINDADNNGGKVVATIASDGVSLLVSDTTGGAGNLIIRRTASNSHGASQLGIETDVAGVAANTVDGTRLISSLGSVLVSNLNGGDGLNGATTITITDRDGESVTVNSLDSYHSLSQVIDAINTQAAAASVDVTIGFNNSGNGLQATDASGGTSNLIIIGDAAEALGLSTAVGGVASTAVRGDNLQLRYIGEGTHLSDLNYGRGIGLGKFRIQDGLGDTADVSIDSDSTTLYDIILEINSRGLAVAARLNDTGDGIVIEADLDVGESPVVPIKITSVNGTTAKDLNILGQSATIENAVIDGSYERTVELSETDTLAKVANKINAAGIPVNASIINSGSGATPYRINFTSAIGGRLGEMIIDSGTPGGDALGMTSLITGKDSKVFFGGTSAEDGFLITGSSNTITGAIEGVTINLKAASEDPVSVTVTRDTTAIVAAVKQFVTTFNDAIGRINQYDFFDVDTEKKGVLLGNPTTSRVREALYRAAQSRALAVDSQYQHLSQVGIKIGRNGELSLDEARFTAAYESDPDGVTNLFAAFEASSSTTEEIVPGVTVQRTEQDVTTRGFGDIFDALLDDLTNSVDGVVTLANNTFRDQIEFANTRIGEFDGRLEAKRRRLESQFTAMEAALARLQGQNGALNSLASNVLLAQTGGA
jgi:flagellar hook-associated protein 2